MPLAFIFVFNDDLPLKLFSLNLIQEYNFQILFFLIFLYLTYLIFLMFINLSIIFAKVIVLIYDLHNLYHYKIYT